MFCPDGVVDIPEACGAKKRREPSTRVRIPVGTLYYGRVRLANAEDKLITPHKEIIVRCHSLTDIFQCPVADQD